MADIRLDRQDTIDLAQPIAGEDRRPGRAAQRLARQSAAPGGGAVKVRVRTLVFTRWIAILGQIVALLTVSEGLDAALPINIAMAVVACSALLNIQLGLRGRMKGWHSDRSAGLYLAYDILQLAALIYLTGGLQNPFSILFLVPVTISATVLSLRSTIGLGLLALACIGLLTFYHQPLPYPDPGFVLPRTYLIGIWTALTLGMIFTMFYSWRVAAEARRMSDALVETQFVLTHEQQLATLGSLAAATAHELGTPLGTIALVAKELSRDVPADSPYYEDVGLLNSEAQRCREILARLSRNPLQSQDSAIDRMGIVTLVNDISEQYDHPEISVEIDAEGVPDKAEPWVMRSPELIQGLSNFIENGLDFARNRLQFQIRWDERHIKLTIMDDGPGFAANIIALLGEPYVTSRPAEGGMGLGVFISKTLLERTGAYVSFSNRRRASGAVVDIIWSRGDIEVPAMLGQI